MDDSQSGYPEHAGPLPQLNRRYILHSRRDRNGFLSFLIRQARSLRGPLSELRVNRQQLDAGRSDWQESIEAELCRCFVSRVGFPFAVMRE